MDEPGLRVPSLRDPDLRGDHDLENGGYPGSVLSSRISDVGSSTSAIRCSNRSTWRQPIHSMGRLGRQLGQALPEKLPVRTEHTWPGLRECGS